MKNTIYLRTYGIRAFHPEKRNNPDGLGEIFCSFFSPIRFRFVHHAFVHQKIGFPVQDVRADHPHAGLPDVRDGAFPDRRDQQGDGPGRALRRHQVSAVGTSGRIDRVQLHVT